MRYGGAWRMGDRGAGALDTKPTEPTETIETTENTETTE